MHRTYTRPVSNYIIFLEFLYLNDIKKRKKLDYIDLADFKCGDTDTTLVSTVKMLQHLHSTYLKRSAEKGPKSKLDGRAPAASE